ncbi:hypothetical protein AGMMS49546_21090 [Spirochaetia bacterium]|nr:hypothetical protein AGMMS49546_21090 [Spirochaetia bacterium]
MDRQAKVRLYAGTYTRQGQSKGIYVYVFNPADGSLKLHSTEEHCNNPSFLSVDPVNKRVYASNEMPNEAYVTSYSMDEEGDLKYLNRLETPGSGMCHISRSKEGSFLYCSNFLSGDLVCCILDGNGFLDGVAGHVSHHGHSVHSKQRGPHIHQAVISPDGRFVFAADFGTDRVEAHPFDSRSGSLQDPTGYSGLSCEPGAAPRHLLFYPNGRWVYLVTELDNALLFCEYEPESGALNLKQRIPVLSNVMQMECKSAGIQLTQDGRYLYVSTRGCDTISRFTIDTITGEPKGPKVYPSLGQGPRMFCFSPDYKYVIIANQQTDNIAVCKFDPDTGEILEQCWDEKIPQPVFVEAVVLEDK